MRTPAHRRAARRLRFRSRSAAVIVVLVAVILVAAYLGTEAVLALIGRAPLLATPFALPGLVRSSPVILPVVTVALTVVGVVCVGLAVLPGGFRRREIADDRMTVLIDDAVVAGGISRAVATATAVPRGQVRTSLSRRRAHVRVIPTTGHPLSADAGHTAGAHTIEQSGLRPAPRTDVRVERDGVMA